MCIGSCPRKPCFTLGSSAGFPLSDDFPLLYTSQNGRARARVRDDFPLLYLTKNCRALRARPFPLLHTSKLLLFFEDISGNIEVFSVLSFEQSRQFQMIRRQF